MVKNKQKAGHTWIFLSSPKINSLQEYNWIEIYKNIIKQSCLRQDPPFYNQQCPMLTFFLFGQRHSNLFLLLSLRQLAFFAFVHLKSFTKQFQQKKLPHSKFNFTKKNYRYTEYRKMLGLAYTVLVKPSITPMCKSNRNEVMLETSMQAYLEDWYYVAVKSD